MSDTPKCPECGGDGLTFATAYDLNCPCDHYHGKVYTQAALDAAVQQARAEERERIVAAYNEERYKRRCVSCKHARVTSAHPDDHPLEARTYCGNDDSPCFDRDVSFFGSDTCGHWAEGYPEPDEECLPKKATLALGGMA